MHTVRDSEQRADLPVQLFDCELNRLLRRDKQDRGREQLVQRAQARNYADDTHLAQGRVSLQLLVDRKEQVG